VLSIAGLMRGQLARSAAERFHWRDVAVGAVFGAEDAGAGALARLRRTAADSRVGSVRPAPRPATRQSSG
jgi:hypothetical protein